MNVKTTLTFLVLAVAGGVLWVVYHFLQPAAPENKTLSVLRNELNRERVTRIDIAQGGKHVILERGAEWNLPGKWPTRQPEVEKLVSLLSTLESRFAPTPIDDGTDLTRFGLDKPAVTVTLRADDTDYRLRFGEEQSASNRFSRPTYLRLNDNREVVRLAPGLVSRLEQPQDYYQQRRLFPSERIQHADSDERIERLAAKQVTAKGPNGTYTLVRSADEWDLREPVPDQADPDKVKDLLKAVPDIWAEHFVDEVKKDVTACGLKEPERTLDVTKANGERIVLLIGKESERTEKRTIMHPAPPFGAPRPPQQEQIVEHFRYAKLKDNDQIFEIKDDRLKDVFISVDTLRDARLARFSSEDARRVELTYPGQHIILEKDKEKWRLQEPIKADAESSKITELLDKLSGLQARDKDVIDKGDAKAYGLDKPSASIIVKVEENKSRADKSAAEEKETKEKKEKTFTFLLGKHDTDKSKLYVRMEGWPRINVVEDAVLKLVERPALAYRGRRVLDFFSSDLAKIEVERGGQGEKFVLEHVKDDWRLALPVQAEADNSKVGQLAGDLGRLEAVEYVNAAPKPEELDKSYGLAKPAVRVTVSFTQKDKPVQTLLLGKQRGDKPEYYAKVDSEPAVFVLKRDIYSTLDQGSLAYRPLQLWRVQPEEIAGVRLQKDGQESRLKREGGAWRIVEPFEATAMTDAVKPLVDELANFKAERYEAHVAKEAGNYGLDKPYLRLAFQSELKTAGAELKDEGVESKKEKTDKPDAKKDGGQEKEKEGKNKQEKAKTEHVLLLGKPISPSAPPEAEGKGGGKSRYAKLGNSEAVFVVGDKFVAAVDRGPLDLLDRHLLSLDTKTIQRVQSDGKEGKLSLQREGDGWRVEAPAAKLQAQGPAAEAFLAAWSGLRAERFVKYDAKVDPKEFGFDQPLATLTVSLAKPAAANDKPVPDHTLVLGKAVVADKGAHYGRLDNGPGVFVLAAPVVKQLTPTYLDFVDRTLLKFDAGRATAIQRRLGSAELELVKRDEGWQIVKPAAGRADEPTLERLLEQLANLRGERVAAYHPKDLKPFGLDAPAATLTIRLAETAAAGPKGGQHVLKIGKLAQDRGQPGDGGRYALADDMAVVAVIGQDLARRLLAEPLQLRDRNLARFADADRATLERGPRKAVFAKTDGTWKLTSPLEAEAEQTDLEDFINALARLRADELVAEKPADLKPYGLDRPEVRWRFQSGDKDVLGLLVGGPEKRGAGAVTGSPRVVAGSPDPATGTPGARSGDRAPTGGDRGPAGGEERRRYAKLATGDLVFLLDPQVSSKVLAEYRSRSVWAPLDAAQVDSLGYRGASSSFVLEKMDNNWRLAGKSEVKLKTEAVTETLDALARLRAERYVVDKDADFRLYGLEPAQLTVEIHTPTGNRVLHIGRAEGNSKRYYARVPESNRSDVFLIAEKEGGQIVRQLSAFTQASATPAKPPPSSSNE